MVVLLLQLIDEDTMRWQPDKIWKWTPLHYAVSAKLPSIVDVLLKHHASPYALSADGKTPIVLAQGELHEVQTLIQQFISNEPAQCVLPGGLDRGALWLGSREAAYPQFATDRGFTSVLSIFDRGLVLRLLEQNHPLNYRSKGPKDSLAIGPWGEQSHCTM